MAWLAIHMWLLLALAFLLGLALGWWIWHCRHDEMMAVAAPQPMPEPEPQPEPVIAPAAFVAPTPDPEPDPEPALDGDRPVLFDTATDGAADDLKKIKGIGPVLEKRLQDVGVFYFRQIAAWTDDNVAWINSKMEFPGRVQREEWVKQAKIFRDGGETEFGQRYDKGETPSSYKDGEKKD